MGLISSILLTCVVIAGILAVQVTKVEKNSEGTANVNGVKTETEEQIVENDDQASKSALIDQHQLIDKNEQDQTLQDSVNQPTQPDLDQFRYSNSNTENSSLDQLVLTTSDDPDNVTDWYKKKIKDLGYNVRTSVLTTVNGDANGVLQASNANTSVDIQIKRSQGENRTIIEVSLKSL